MKSLFKTIIAIILIFAVFIGCSVVFSKLNSNASGDSGGSSNGVFGGFFDGIIEDIFGDTNQTNPNNYPYYAETATGTIDFDFSEPAVLFDNGKSKYEAKEGFLFFGSSNGTYDSNASYVTFPLNKDGSVFDLQEVNTVEYSFDVIYDWNDEKFGDYKTHPDMINYWRQTVSVFYLNINNDYVGSTPDWDVSLAVGCHQVEGIEGEDYDGISVNWDLYDSNYNVYEPGDIGYHFMHITFRLVRNSVQTNMFDLQIYVDNVLEDNISSFCSESTPVYGLTIFNWTTPATEKALAYDNLKVTIK